MNMNKCLGSELFFKFSIRHSIYSVVEIVTIYIGTMGNEYVCIFLGSNVTNDTCFEINSNMECRETT